MPAQESRDDYRKQIWLSSDKSSTRESLNKNLQELQLLANFYHRHGYDTQAQEIYRSILALREKLDSEHHL